MDDSSTQLPQPLQTEDASPANFPHERAATKAPATATLLRACLHDNAVALHDIQACLAELESGSVVEESEKAQLGAVAVTQCLLAIMEAHVTDESAVITVARLLSRTLDKQMPSDIEIPGTAAATLMSMLTQHAGSAEAVTWLCRVLRFVARAEHQQVALGTAERIGLLATLLARYDSDVTAVIAIASALWNALLLKANIEVAEKSLAETLLRLLREHSSNAAAARELAGSLRNMLVRSTVVTVDVLPTAVTVLRTHARDADVVVVLASLLRAVAGEGGKLEAALRAHGVVPLLLDLIRAHAGNNKATIELFFLLAQTCTTDENERLAVNTGALRLAVATLLVNPDDADVCIAVCHALRYLCWAMPHKIAFVADDGVALVLRALKRHINDNALVRIACRVVRNACIGCIANTQAFVAAGVAETLVEALRTTSDTDTTVSICVSVTDLAHEQESFRVAFTAADGLPLVLTALQRPDVTAPQARTMAATLRNICNDTAAKSVMLHAGAVPALVAGLSRFGASPEVCYLLCGTLENMARNFVDAKKAIMQAKGCEAVVTVLRRHVQSVDVASHACGALQNVAVVEDFKGAIVEAGGAAALAAVLRAHPGVPRVLIAALGALNNVALHPPNRTALCSAGVALLIVEAMRRSGEDAVVTRLGAQVLSSLCDEPMIPVVLRLARCERLAAALVDKYSGGAAVSTRDACAVLVRKLGAVDT